MSLSEFFRRLLMLSFLAGLAVSNFDLVIIHINDIRGRYIEVFEKYHYPCTITKDPKCSGGLPRIYRYVQNVKKGGKNVLFLFAGNVAVGTSWYDLFKWNISQVCINAMKFDVVSIGAYDLLMRKDFFPYVKNLIPPIVTCNIKSDVIKPSVTLDMDGNKVGVIGFLGDKMELYVPREFQVDYETTCIRNEIDKFQREGVKVLILLVNADLIFIKELISKFPEFDAVVYGGNREFYWHNNLQPDQETIDGYYPPIVHVGSKMIPLVSTSGYSKYVGQLYLKFNDKGEVKHIGGKVAFLNGPKDDYILSLLDPYRGAAMNRTRTVIGTTSTFLDYKHCLKEECALGNLLTNAYKLYYRDVHKGKCSGIYTVLSLTMGRDLQYEMNRSPPPTVIVDLYHTFPYHREIFLLEITGTMLRAIFENGVAEFPKSREFPNFIQAYGVKVKYNMIKPTGYRVVELKVRECTKNWYHEVKDNNTFQVLTTGMVARIVKTKFKEVEPKPLEVNTLYLMEWYYNQYSPVTAREEGRIGFIDLWNFAKIINFWRYLLALTFMTILL